MYEPKNRSLTVRLSESHFDKLLKIRHHLKETKGYWKLPDNSDAVRILIDECNTDLVRKTSPDIERKTPRSRERKTHVKISGTVRRKR